ncbi:hypothetical protein EWM64_g5146 [Hericium alpestre]|uniref:Uncharacterized protein n=1 Tax=Hericium alpestre TaxID=135208 RepID=A0A4Y9ZWB9_9AGAM|nr:hypothetical protein EWM64_g5146 [Hericium alpestre]
MRTTIVALAFGLSSVSALPTGPARQDSGSITPPDSVSADLCALNGSCTSSTVVPSAPSVVPSASINEDTVSTSVIVPCPASTAQPSNTPDTIEGSGSLSVFDGFKRWIGLSNRDVDDSASAEASDASCGAAGSSVPTNETTTATTVDVFGPASTSTARRARLSNRDADAGESSASSAAENALPSKKLPEFIPGWNRDVHDAIQQRDVDDLDAIPADDSEAVPPEPTSTPTFADYASSVTASASPLDDLIGEPQISGLPKIINTENMMAGWLRDVGAAAEQRDVDDTLLASESDAILAEPTSTPTFVDYASSISASAVPADNLESPAIGRPLVSYVGSSWNRRDVQDAADSSRSLHGRQLGSVGGDARK